jgi:hypothetical protein
MAAPLIQRRAFSAFFYLASGVPPTGSGVLCKEYFDQDEGAGR